MRDHRLNRHTVQLFSRTQPRSRSAARRARPRDREGPVKRSQLCAGPSDQSALTDAAVQAFYRVAVKSQTMRTVSDVGKPCGPATL
jgi:hypothetical protein